MPATSAASREAARQQTRSAASSSAGGSYVLTANWGAIAVTLCAAPWVAFLLFNPISLFFLCFWAVALTFVTFGPKLVHFLLLEFAIVQGRGTEFYDKNHARRIRGTLPQFDLSRGFLEALSAELSSRVGAPDAVSAVALKEVAVARKKYVDGQALPYDDMADRLVRLPWQIVVRFKDHAKGCVQVSGHAVLRFLALNVVARLYTKTYTDE